MHHTLDDLEGRYTAGPPQEGVRSPIQNVPYQTRLRDLGPRQPCTAHRGSPVIP